MAKNAGRIGLPDLDDGVARGHAAFLQNMPAEHDVLPSRGQPAMLR
jgi:hypothetical protein